VTPQTSEQVDHLAVALTELNRGMMRRARLLTYATLTTDRLDDRDAPG